MSRTHGTRSLRVDMQMRLTGIAGVPHGAEPDANGDCGPRMDLEASGAQVTERRIGRGASQHADTTTPD